MRYRDKFLIQLSIILLLFFGSLIYNITSLNEEIVLIFNDRFNEVLMSFIHGNVVNGVGFFTIVELVLIIFFGIDIGDVESYFEFMPFYYFK